MGNADPVMREVTTRLSRYSVGLMREQKNSDGTLVLVSTGTGTVCDIAGVRCILTAAHVTNEIMNGETGGIHAIGLPSRSQVIQEFAISDWDHISFGLDNTGPAGPDISLIKLPPYLDGWLRDERVSYNIFARSKNDREDRPASFLMGLPAEATKVGAFEFAGQRFDKITLMAIGGERGPTEAAPSKHDRFLFETKYEAAVNLRNLGGVSGGGVWGLDPYRSEVSPVLMGVAYYQMPEEPGDPHSAKVYCSGPTSIYEQMFTSAHRRWS